MFGPFAAALSLFAQAAAPAATNPLVQFLPFVPVFLFGYLLLIRPQQQQERKRKEMIKKLKKNDKVLTMAGIYGTVLSVDTANDRVVLRVDDDGRIKIPFTMASVVRVVEVSDRPETIREV